MQAGRTPVLVALGTGAWASAMADDLEDDVVVAARCAFVEDLLVTAAMGVADAVVVSAYLAGLDRDVLSRLAACGLGVVGAVHSGDEKAERQLRQLGISHVHVDDWGTATLADALGKAAGAPAGSERFANPFAALPEPSGHVEPEEPVSGGGRVVAVWGPAGAPGRSSVALGLASELASLGWPSLLVDADVYGGSLATMLGLPEDVSGIAAACRAANLGLLDVPSLGSLALEVAPELSVLTGLPSADRWPELRPSGIEVVLTLARTLAAVTVVDCGFSIEQDEELSYDTLAPRRNGATLAALESADLVVVVGRADPVGARRLLGALDELADAVPGVPTSVVVNRARPSGPAEVELRTMLERHAGVERVTFLPLDVEAVDASLSAQRPLLEVAPESALRGALADYTRGLVATAAPMPRSGGASFIARLLAR